MAFSTAVGSIELGLIFAIMSLGLFIAFRILDLPDLTVDGSFVTGIAFASVCTEAGHPFLGLAAGLIGGVLAGIVTGLLHTKLHLHAILAGILTMTGLYSVNLKIMGERPSIFFYNSTTIFSGVKGRLFLNGYDMGPVLLLAVMTIVLVIVMDLFLKTMPGLSLRATGDNEAMVRSSSINTDFMKIFGFALTNGIVAFAGAIYAEYCQTGVHAAGTGMLVLGLASIIIGETLIGKRGMLRHLTAVALGAVIYRMMLTAAFQIGLPAADLKLFSASIVVIAIAIPVVKNEYVKRRGRHA